MKKRNLLFIFLYFLGVALFSQLPGIEWQRSLGGFGYEQGYSVKQTSDGGYTVCGSSPSNDGDVTGHHGGGDYWIVKLGPDIMGVQDFFFSHVNVFSQPGH